MAILFRMLVLLLISATATLAQAATSTLSGTITSAPEMPVVTIITPSCHSQGTFPVNYHVQPFVVSASGSYQISATSVTGTLPLNDASFYIYQNAFDPANGMVNCIGASNGNPANIPALPLTAGIPYFLVVFDDTTGQITDTSPSSFVVTFDGLGLTQSGHPVPAAVPTLSQLSLILLGALLAGGTAAARRRTGRPRT